MFIRGLVEALADTRSLLIAEIAFQERSNMQKNQWKTITVSHLLTFSNKWKRVEGGTLNIDKEKGSWGYEGTEDLILKLKNA